MKPVSAWLDEYGESHQNSLNIKIHHICVPLIMLSLVSLLSTISLGLQLLSNYPIINNWGFVLVLFATIYYFFLSVTFFLGMIPIAFLLLLGAKWLDSFNFPLWIISLIIFAIAWIGQFYGHIVEGKRPSFFKDVQFLLIGPLWLLSKFYKKFNINY